MQQGILNRQLMKLERLSPVVEPIPLKQIIPLPEADTWACGPKKKTGTEKLDSNLPL